MGRENTRSSPERKPGVAGISRTPGRGGGLNPTASHAPAPT